VHLMWTFFRHQVQPLRHWATTMWLYLRPSCPTYPFSEKLCDAEVNTRIYKVLAYGADLNPRADPAPLREGVDSTRMSPFRSIFWVFA
jgi:hypothetical protein